eukprot:gnl/Trimastix_PCT/3072.p1 GENE.gnl/Trimastix_PCT/3072~~gnl/Trimastix_PCT/3072.p1  ORF type:complete len:488 (-),score=99.52 gnl/Trimastix_PCT/3072:295-1758(-)
MESEQRKEEVTETPEQANESEQPSADGPPMSKKQRKRLARFALQKENRKKKRAELKERKKKQREEWRAGLTEEEREALHQRTIERVQQRREARLAIQKKLAEVGQTALSIAIDLSYDHLMTDREIISLKQQIMYAYGTNKRAAVPCRMHLTSLGGRTEQRLREISGFENWQVNADARHYTEVIPKEQLVYLTSESPTTIYQLDPHKTYVIGGIVDHNRHKGLTHADATRLGLETAALPIKEFLTFESRDVLAVNHVFDILIFFHETQDWTQALLRAVPARKAPKVRHPKAVPAHPIATTTEPKGETTQEEEEEEAEEEEEEEEEAEEEGGGDVAVGAVASVDVVVVVVVVDVDVVDVELEAFSAPAVRPRLRSRRASRARMRRWMARSRSCATSSSFPLSAMTSSGSKRVWHTAHWCTSPNSWIARSLRTCPQGRSTQNLCRPLVSNRDIGQMNGAVSASSGQPGLGTSKAGFGWKLRGMRSLRERM